MGPTADGAAGPTTLGSNLPLLCFGKPEALKQRPATVPHASTHKTQCVQGGRVSGSRAKKPQSVYFHLSVKTASARLRLRNAPSN